MWNPLVIDDDNYLIKLTRDPHGYKVYLTDVINMWTEELTEEQLSRRCKENNPLVEADHQSLVEKVLLLLERQEDAEMSLSITADSATLKFKSTIADVPFYFTLNMMKTSLKTFSEVLTLPLVKVILQQEQQVNLMCQMLRAKDAEIEQYKLEGAVLKKRRLETEPFTEKALSSVQGSALFECPENLLHPARLFNSSLLSSLANASYRDKESLQSSQETKPALQEPESEQPPVPVTNPPPLPREVTQGSSDTTIPKVEPGTQTASASKVKLDASPIPKKRAMKQKKPISRPKLRL